MGTATYFSPEQAQGHAVDPRSDLYSLGCVLYEMLAARPPFAGDSPVAVAYKHVQEQPVAPSRINPNVPPALEAIDLKLLEKDPAQRYASAEDLRSDLRRFLEGQPVLAAGAIGGAGAGVVIGAGLTGAAPADATTMVPATSGAGGGAGFGGPPTTGGNYSTPPEKNRTGLYVGLTIGALVLIGLILFFVGSSMGKSTEQVAVPDVTTKSQTDATNALQTAGFKVSVKNVANDTIPANQVFEQTPKGNTNADKGSTVEITVSSGIGDATVPDVVGRTQAAAESLLKTNNFIPEVKEAASDTVAKGTVISQSPSANAKATKNSVVTITVSTGAADVSIPNVVGLNEASASNQLGQAGFTVTRKSQSNATVPAGNVISTNPTAGTKAAKGSSVEITVSNGPATPTTPSTTTTTTTAP
jgi:serine/threonine-protein kinase